MSRAKDWCFTLNNWTTDQQDHVIAQFDREDVKYLVFGREAGGTTGTPHLQGFIQFSQRKRLSQCRQLFQAHWEVRRGTVSQAASYCKKDGDFEEFGEQQNNQGAGGGQLGQWEQLREWINALDGVPTMGEIILEFPNLVARYPDAVRTYVSLVLPQVRLTEATPRDGWQTALSARLEQPADDRTVEFVVDPLGNSGKTWFCQYLFTHHPTKTQILGMGKREDLTYLIDEEKSIFLFDIPRDSMQFFQYSVVEMLKNRMVQQTKYQSRTKLFRTPVHVVVFCNELPDMTKLSLDRFRITELSNQVING